MDTRYWGPSGWRLLHLLAAHQTPSKEAFQQFFGELPFVLPCKWCRRNLSFHQEELPFTDTKDLEQYMYVLHNKVNTILKKSKPYPTFAQVRDIYRERLDYGCTKTEFPGWPFLFSIVKDHPIQRGNLPIPDAPPIETLQTDQEKNKWNLLTPAERFSHWVAFWETLPKTFPFQEWTQAWNESIDPENPPSAWTTSSSAMKALWRLRCTFEQKLSLLNKTSYRELCNDLTFYRSGCASRNVKSKTCRRLRQTRKSQR